MDDFDKILSYYISHHNKKFDIYFFKCDFQMDFDNNFIAQIEIDYHYNNDTKNLKSYLIFYIDSCELAGYKIKNNNGMIINIVSDRCNMTKEYYFFPPLHPPETKLNIVLAENPQLLDENKNNILIKKIS